MSPAATLTAGSGNTVMPMDYGAPNKRAAALGLASALAYVTLSGYDRLQVGFLADRVVATSGPYWGRHQRSMAYFPINPEW